MKYDVKCNKCSTRFVVEKNPSCPRKKPKHLLALCPTCNVTRKTIVSLSKDNYENTRALSKLLYMCALIYFAYMIVEIYLVNAINLADILLLFVLGMSGYITSR
ncbi:MAG: hypothetical protein ACE5K4_01050 [Candidatus Hydrothermarchaeota archaeon]